VTADPWPALARLLARWDAAGTPNTVLVVRDATGRILAWEVARSGARLAKRYPSRPIERERSALDARAHVRLYPVAQEIRL
jgi:hypothetical protein